MTGAKSLVQKLPTRFLLALTMTISVFILAVPAFAQSNPKDAPFLLGQEQPYQPDVTSIAPPGWLEGLGPLSSLPVWAIAAILAAVVAALFVVVPAAVKWIWVWRSTRDSET